MSLRENMQSLYKTFGKDHDENFEATKAALLQLRKEPDSKENKAIMKECITALIELKKNTSIQTNKLLAKATNWTVSFCFHETPA